MIVKKTCPHLSELHHAPCEGQIVFIGHGRAVHHDRIHAHLQCQLDTPTDSHASEGHTRDQCKDMYAVSLSPSAMFTEQFVMFLY